MSFFIRPGDWNGFPSTEYAFPSKFEIYLEHCPRGEAFIISHLRLSSNEVASLHWAIVTLQKKAVRAITSSAYNAHTSPIFKNLRLLKIYDIYTLQQLKFYYKMVHTNLPIYFNTLPLIRNPWPQYTMQK